MPRREVLLAPKKPFAEPKSVVESLKKKIAPLPGRIALLMAKPEQQGMVVLTEKSLEREKPAFGTVVMSGFRGVSVGEVCGINLYDGLQYFHEDAPWVPEGREVRFLRDPDSVMVKLG